jgi:SHS2 domain-containing protein
MRGTRYRWVEHTAELELHIDAPTEGRVFVEALRAFAELVDEGPAGDVLVCAVALAAPDRGVLLVRWLEELVFRAETEGLVPEAVEDLELTADGLVATLRGRRGDPRHLVKGVSLHGLVFRPAGEGFEASVVLDV